jgi:hypothetical protein
MAIAISPDGVYFTALSGGWPAQCTAARYRQRTGRRVDAVRPPG